MTSSDFTATQRNGPFSAGQQAAQRDIDAGHLPSAFAFQRAACALATALAAGRLYTTEQLADRYCTSPESVKYWRRRGTGPVWFRAGKHVRYRESDVIAWENTQVQHAGER